MTMPHSVSVSTSDPRMPPSPVQVSPRENHSHRPMSRGTAACAASGITTPTAACATTG